MIEQNNIEDYKYLFEEIGLVMESIMSVLCDQECLINDVLFRVIDGNSETVGKTIVLPTDTYDESKWLTVLCSHLPGIDIPLEQEWFDALLRVFQN